MTGRVTGTVLVTGAAGLVGGYLTAELLDRGYQVTGVDRLAASGQPPQSQASHPAYRFVCGDAAHRGLLAGLLAGCDHFIAGTGLAVAASCDAAITAYKSGTLRKITYLAPPAPAQTEARWPEPASQSRWPDWTGSAWPDIEYYAQAGWQKHGLPFTIVRPLNCVGTPETPGMDDAGGEAGALPPVSRLLAALIRSVLSGDDPVHVPGPGSAPLCLTYGGDVARGIALAMEEPAAAGQDISLAAQQRTSVADLAALVWAKIRGPDSPPQVICDEPAWGSGSAVAADTEQARQILGFTATTGLDEMLDEVIGWVSGAVTAGQP